MCQKLEQERDELRARVRELEAKWLAETEEKIRLRYSKTQLEEENANLRRRLEKLEAVAEAARLLLSTCALVECFPKDDRFSRCLEDDCPEKQLKKALSAIEGGGGA